MRHPRGRGGPCLCSRCTSKDYTYNRGSQSRLSHGTGRHRYNHRGARRRPSGNSTGGAKTQRGDCSVRHGSSIQDHDCPTGTGETVVGVTLIDPNQRLEHHLREWSVLGPGAQSDSILALDLGLDVRTRQISWRPLQLWPGRRNAPVKSGSEGKDHTPSEHVPDPHPLAAHTLDTGGKTTTHHVQASHQCRGQVGRHAEQPAQAVQRESRLWSVQWWHSRGEKYVDGVYHAVRFLGVKGWA